jgi:hypothetical protein
MTGNEAMMSVIEALEATSILTSATCLPYSSRESMGIMCTRGATSTAPGLLSTRSAAQFHRSDLEA